MPSLGLLSSLLSTLTSTTPSSSSSSSSTTHSLIGTGPYAPTTSTSPALPRHLIYQPTTLSTMYGPDANDSIPVIIWANNACTKTTDPYAKLNSELASWGMLVLACGPSSSALAALDKYAGVEGSDWASIEKDGVGMLGTSCGGAGVYAAANDSRVLSLGILDSGVGTGAGKGVSNSGSAGGREQDTTSLAKSATKPVFYFQTSPLYISGTKDAVSGTQEISPVEKYFNAVAKGVPAWYGVLPGSDVQTLSEGSAGKLGRAVRFWAMWMVGGQQQDAKAFFVDARGAESEGWTVVRKGMGVLSV
ncbi:hypothetical protein E8E13_002439 [Curvularia kusanoi]|uniref:Alpha/beta-hydrolase n=1 Tax=Curvularia kusanoi TaxID=90978 RepID=A0A9P4TC59_CURKU|nr:hypothetical protein E8E13_002439 [Curvularia kusanoi]